MRWRSLGVKENGRIVLELPRAEVGQGITTAMAMLVTGEMDAKLSDVDVVLSDARPELMFNQITSASISTRELFGPVRLAASEARLRRETGHRGPGAAGPGHRRGLRLRGAVADVREDRP